MKPVFNATVESIGKTDNDQLTVPYTSTNRMLTAYTKKSESRVQFARRRAPLAVFITIIRAKMASDNSGNKKLYPPLTAGRYILTGSNCLDKSGHKDFEVWEGRSSEFLCSFLGLKLYASYYVLRHRPMCTIRLLRRTSLQICST